MLLGTGNTSNEVAGRVWIINTPTFPYLHSAVPPPLSALSWLATRAQPGGGG